MSDDSKFLLSLISIVCLAVVALTIVFNLGWSYEDDNKLKEFEAATKAGLVQRVDPATSKVIWVKPHE